MTRKYDPDFTPEGVRDTAPGNPAVAHCARAGSVQMQTPPGAVHPHIVDAFSPDNLQKARAKEKEDSDWPDFFAKLGHPHATTDHIGHVAAALVVLPEADRLSLAEKAPLELLSLLGMATHDLPDDITCQVFWKFPNLVEGFGIAAERHGFADVMEALGSPVTIN